MIPLLLFGGLLLLSSPGLVTVRRGHPAHWTRNALTLQLTGFVLVEVGLMLWAVPALLDLVGATDLARICRRMLDGLAPGGWPAGAAAGAAASALATLAFRGAWRVRSAQRRMRVEPWLGTHYQRYDHHLVVLPTDDLVAYTVGGRSPQVVISQGLVETVGGELTDAVCAHEAAHAQHKHHRFIVALGAISSAFAWFPPARRAVAAVQFGLERWADEEAGESTNGREGVRHALLAVTLARLGPEVAAFGSDTIAERARALSGSPPRSSVLWAAAGYAIVSLAVVAAASSLAWATSMSILAVANPGLCVL